MDIGADWRAIRLGLEALMHSVGEEIHTYPRPITACDAQFNHLLELRRQIPALLEQLAAAEQDPIMTPAQFIATSPCATELRTALSGLGVAQST